MVRSTIVVVQLKLPLFLSIFGSFIWKETFYDALTRHSVINSRPQINVSRGLLDKKSFYCEECASIITIGLHTLCQKKPNMVSCFQDKIVFKAFVFPKLLCDVFAHSIQAIIQFQVTFLLLQSWDQKLD